MRYYFSTFIGAGTMADPFRPVALDIIRQQEPATAAVMVDGRADPATAVGSALVAANVSDATHAVVAADARVVVIPFTNAAGAGLPPGALLSQVSAAKRTAIRDACEARHIPTADLTGANTIREALTRIANRFLMRQVLRGLDYTEGLDTLVGDIPPARRQQISAALAAVGFSTAGITQADTVREALAKTIVQSGRAGVTVMPGEVA